MKRLFFFAIPVVDHLHTLPNGYEAVDLDVALTGQ